MSKLCGVQNLTKQLKSFKLNHTSIAPYAMTSGGTGHKYTSLILCTSLPRGVKPATSGMVWYGMVY